MDHRVVQVMPTERINERMLKLKEKFPNENDQSLHPMLLKEKHSIPGGFISSELSNAVKKGNPDDFVDILTQVSSEKQSLSAIFDQVTGTGDSLLHLAAKNGSEEIAELIAQHFPKLLIQPNIKGDTALHMAARAQKPKVVKIILHHYHAEENDHKLLTRMQNVYGNTALHDAVKSDCYEVVACLCSADPLASHIANKSCKSPMYLAVLASDDRICILLLQAPFQKDIPRSQGNSPLHAAILEKKSPALIKKILKERPELMYLKNENGDTALHCACAVSDDKNKEAVEIFLMENSSTNLAKNTNGYLPIHVACQNGKLEILQKFLQNLPESAFALTVEGQNILHVAAMHGRDDLVKYILNKTNFGEHILNEQDNNGNTPLHLASKDLQTKVLGILTNHKSIRRDLENNDGKVAWEFISVEKKKEEQYARFLFLVRILTHIWGVPVKERIKSMSRQEKDEKPSSHLKDLINNLMLVSILVTTVTFAAGFTLPGGVYESSESDKDKRGTAVLIYDFWFQLFAIFNSHAMFSSIVASFILFGASLGDDVWGSNGFLIALLLMIYSLVGTLIAFIAASRSVMIHASWIVDVVTIVGELLIFIIPVSILLWIFPLGVIDSDKVRGPEILYDILIRTHIPYTVGHYKEPEEDPKSQQMEKQVSKKMDCKQGDRPLIF